MATTTEDKYQQLEHREHIYKLPDTYIGSIESSNQEMYVIEEKEDKMSFREITYIPGFFKIFDEILVNAIDHRQRDENVRNIKVNVQLGLNEISIMNDGSGIDVCIHSVTNIYVPEMLFGHLLTSSNYNENEKRTVGGKNGYGATVTNIFSEYFIIETVDSQRQLKYIQKFEKNGTIINPPKITKYSSKSYTKVIFKPDYTKFKLPEGITTDIFSLFKKRVFDITAVTPKDLNVWFNGEKLKIKSMEKYIELYQPESKVFFVEQHRWKVGLVLSPNREFLQVSFVNGIWTIKGGRHVDYILNQIVDKIKAYLAHYSKTKNKIIKTSQIKDNIWLFIDSVIENPNFTSQTKEEMTSKISQFGSTCIIEDSWVEKWVKHNDTFIDRLMEHQKLEEQKTFKKTDGVKRNVIKGIPKLEDAIQAGTRNSHKCTLILCEGDSAKASILSGVSSLGNKRDYFGIFPLRGKFINVRDISNEKINSNEEVKNLKVILGLQHNKTYSIKNISELRYGSITIATDADCDGSHIKGLVINFFHYFWPSLLEIDGFIKTLYTPIVKGTNSAGKSISFYNINEYKLFKENTKEKWNYKYFKGLGTSTSKEFKEYFSKLNDITVNYSLDNHDPILMAFSKDKADQRKSWLQIYDPEDTIQFSKDLKNIIMTDFINKELKHFSNYDNYRSIPNVIDGLKPSQRKVLYGLLKKGNIKEIKVAQLASYVSEVTQYHHGEVSLEQTIVSMAQNFVGKNNVPLLKAIGQFGTRLSSKDYAQSRYIFTALQDYTWDIYNEEDNSLLDYLEDEDKKIEPFCFYPILPMLLINGSEGIGTGYSTQIPCFNSKEIIDSIEKRGLQNEPFKKEWIPYYEGFKGTIKPVDSKYKKFTVSGVYKIEGNKLIVTELPVGVWTNTFKEHLEGLIVNNTISSYLNKSTDELVYFEIHLNKTDINVEKVFKLENNISLNNLHAYKNKVIHKFEDISEILEYYYTQRIEKYGERREYNLQKLKDQINILNEKIRFIYLVLDNPDIIFRKTKQDIIKVLEAKEFVHINVLIQMPIYNWSLEKIQEFENDKVKLQNKYDILFSKTSTDLYIEELDNFKKHCL